MRDFPPDLADRENASRRVPFKTKATPVRFQRKAPQADGGNEIWFLTLSDLLMLLMIFFVLLFGMTLYQKNQTAEARHVPVSAAPPAPAEAAPAPPADAAASLETDLLSLLGGDPGQGVTLERRSGQLVLTFPERIMFDSGQARIQSPVQPLLEKVARFIVDHGELSVEVHGHTDDRPISSGRYPSNWELSADRAAQVARTLVRLGVRPEKVSIRGFGENRPLYPNDTDSHRLQNRRVEIQFTSLSRSP